MRPLRRRPRLGGDQRASARARGDVALALQQAERLLDRLGRLVRALAGEPHLREVDQGFRVDGDEVGPLGQRRLPPSPADAPRPSSCGPGSSRARRARRPGRSGPPRRPRPRSRRTAPTPPRGGPARRASGRASRRCSRAGPSRPSRPAARSLSAAAPRPPRALPRASPRAPPAARPPIAGRPARRGSRLPRATSRRASSKSPAIACSAASGWSVRASATGLCATCSRISSQRRIASGTGVGPNSAAEARQASSSNSAGLVPGAARVRARALSNSSSDCPQRPSTHALSARRKCARDWPSSSPSSSSTSQRRVGDLRGALRGGVGARLEANQLALDACAGGQRRVGGGQLDRFGEHGLGLGQAACVEQRRSQPGQERRAGRVAGSGQARGALQQARATAEPSPRIRAASAAASSRAEAARASSRSRSPTGAEVGEQQVGLGEVVPDRLVAGAGRRLEPARDALVQLGAALLRQPVVGRLADQRVREAEGVLPGDLRALGADQLVLDERDQVGETSPRSGRPPVL